MILILVTLMAGGHSGPAPVLDADQLCRERTLLFDATRDFKDNGFFGGAEGSGHEVLYEVGRSDRLYYFAYRDGDPYHPTTAPPRVEIAKWVMEAGRPVKRWHVRFRPSSAHPFREFRPHGAKVMTGTGTLLVMAYLVRLGFFVGTGPGTLNWETWAERFVPDPKSEGWKLGKVDLQRPQTLIAYHFGSGGDISLKTSISVVDGSGSYERLPESNTLTVNGPPITTEAEKALIKESMRQDRRPTKFAFLNGRAPTNVRAFPSTLNHFFSFKADFAKVVAAASEELIGLGFKRGEMSSDASKSARFSFFDGRDELVVTIDGDTRSIDASNWPAPGWVTVYAHWSPPPRKNT